MFRVLVSLLLLGSAALCGGSLQRAADVNNRAALEVYSELMHENGNLLYSPYSFLTAMSIVTAGAQGETLEQIIEALKLPTELQELHSGQGALLRHINKGAYDSNSWSERGRRALNAMRSWFGAEEKATPLVLSTANRLWIEETLAVEAPFTGVVEQHYQGGLGRVDFQNSPEEARSDINRWVEKQTNNKIQDLLAEGSIDNLTRMVIANALYMKGDWKRPFEEELTSTQTFYLRDGSERPVKLMYQAVDHQLLLGDDYAALELPYHLEEDSHLDVVLRVYLPNERGELAELEDRLIEDGELLQGQVWQKRKVHVYLPRFKLEDKHSLPQLLQDMGITDAFSDAANFEGIARGAGLYIGDIVQKTFMEVDEQGTEAAAATAITVVTRSAPIEPKPYTFRADHPFLVTLVDKSSGLLLFIGRVSEP